MSKNFIYWKSGHKTSDEYFKNSPVWHDIDVAKSFIFGVFVGSGLTVVIYIFLLHL
jgi:hypothetical protein